MVIAKTHRLARHQRVERTKDGGVAKTFGNAARIEGVKRFWGRVVASVHQDLLKDIGLVQNSHLSTLRLPCL